MDMRSSDVSRRWLLGALLSGAAVPAFGQAPRRSIVPKARPAAAGRAAGPAVPSATALIDEAQLTGKIGYVLADAHTGRVLESHNAHTHLPPGSVTKVFTTTYALDHLGPDYRFTTRIVATGPVRDGKVQGDLILLGGGDPALDTDALGDMTVELRALGVTGATGRFLYDASALPTVRSIDPGQPAQAAYDPGLSGLNLNFNRVHFEWTRTGKGYQLALDARGLRYMPLVECVRMTAVDRDGPLYTYAADGDTEDWTVATHALGRHGNRWLPVRNSALYTAAVFHSLAEAQGIALPRPAPGKAPASAQTLVTHKGDPLSKVLREMLFYSTNLTAEIVGLTSSAAMGQPQPTLAASGQLMTEWAAKRFGIDAHFADHSGLAPGTRVSPDNVMKVLKAEGPQGRLRDLLKKITPLDSHGRPLYHSPLKIRAKTGTLNFVSGLAGYIAAPGDTHLIFAIISADVPRRDAVPKAERIHPPGFRRWVRHARQLQQNLIERWARVY